MKNYMNLPIVATLLLLFLILPMVSFSEPATPAKPTPDSIQPFDQKMDDDQRETVRQLVRQILSGNKDVIRMMEFKDFELMFNPVEEKINKWNGQYPDFKIHMFHERLFGASGTTSFIFGLHNVDYRIRIRVAAVLLHYLQSETPGNIPRESLRKEIDTALNCETVVESRDELKKLKKRLGRCDWEIRISQEAKKNKELFKSMGLEDFLSLAEPFEGEPSLLDSMSEEYLDLFVSGLYHENIRVRLECSKHLIRLAKATKELKNIAIIEEAFVRARTSAERINLQLGNEYYGLLSPSLFVELRSNAEEHPTSKEKVGAEKDSVKNQD